MSVKLLNFLSLIRRKKSDITIKNGLQSYWSFCNNVRDIVSGSELYDGTNVYFIYNPFGLADSALSLRDGYYKVSPGFYFFGGDFIISVWLRLIQIRYFSRIIDFGNNINNSVAFSMYEYSLKPQLLLTYDEGFLSLIATTSLELGEWYYLTALMENNYAKIYINGILDVSIYNEQSAQNIYRQTNYIGKSNWYQDENAYSDMFDLKIYNKALTETEIIDDMNGE